MPQGRGANVLRNPIFLLGLLGDGLGTLLVIAGIVRHAGAAGLSGLTIAGIGVMVLGAVLCALGALTSR